MNKKKIMLVILGVMLLIILVSGITYAAFMWTSDPNKGYIDLNSQCFDVIYVKGEDITGSNIKLGTSYKDGSVTTEIKVNISDSCKILGTGTLYLNTKDVTSAAFVSNNVLNYQVLDNGSEVSSGVVNTKGKIPIYEGFEVNYDVKTLSIYLWVNTLNVTDANVDALYNDAVYSGSISLEMKGDRRQ